MSNRWLHKGCRIEYGSRNQRLQEADMEYGTIEREIYVEASPEVVFEVVSSPDHLKRWWPDDARYEPAPGAAGEIVFGDRDAGGTVVAFTVVDAQPPRMFSFRWTHPAHQVAAEGNSLLVTFDLTPSGGGTLLRMTETGFREMGWSAALLEQQYNDHVTGWDFYLPRLVSYAATLEPRP
jgi:uncharacterized protein YndB with AHSA1/START domain